MGAVVLWVVFLILFLLCAAMSAAFSVYICFLWYVSIRPPPVPDTKGLSPSELGMLPEGEARGECSVCLDDLEAGQPARVLPTCGHAFHKECADAWLASRPACPLCRAVLPRLV